MNLAEYIIRDLPESSALILIFLAITVVFAEDLTTIAAAGLTLAGKITAPWALAALFGGILLAEGFCYTLGRLAHRSKIIKKIMEKEGMYQVMNWLDNNLMIAVLAARYVPGLRIAVYGAMGYYRLNTKALFAISMAVVFVWTGGLFLLVTKFGAHYWEQLGPTRWYIIAAFCLCLMILAHYIQQEIRIRIEKKEKIKTRRRK
ncbi:MAG: VTT domain-containing protein [Alphaproteobacteria bacterium]|nr:VTT domain-containing protein [Alphaproteobacteria bacterium]